MLLVDYGSGLGYIQKPEIQNLEISETFNNK